MNKISIYMVVFAFGLLTVSSCKSTKNTSKISGARKVATTQNQQRTAKPAATVPEFVPPVPPPLEEEVTRAENFILAEGENPATDVLNRRYHVVVGSFKSRENAKGLQATLKKEGNDAVIVVTESAMYRVIVSSHNTYTDARTRINKIASRFPDAWVLVKDK